MNLKHYISINNKKYFYTIKKADKNSSFFECKAANISQEFLKEDIADLLNNLANLIITEKKYKKQQSEIIRFRVSTADKKIIEQNAIKKGYPSVSGYLRDLSLGNI